MVLWRRGGRQSLWSRSLSPCRRSPIERLALSACPRAVPRRGARPCRAACGRPVRVRAMRWKILRRLRRITGALPIGRKKPARVQFALRDNRKRTAPFRAAPAASPNRRQTAPAPCAARKQFIADKQHGLRQIERGIGWIDGKGHDDVGQRHLVVGEAGALGPEQHASLLSRCDGARGLRHGLLPASGSA